jgi:hypothetical protein
MGNNKNLHEAASLLSTPRSGDKVAVSRKRLSGDHSPSQAIFPRESKSLTNAPSPKFSNGVAKHLLGKMACTIGAIENFISKDREVKSKTETNRVS